MTSPRGLRAALAFGGATGCSLTGSGHTVKARTPAAAEVLGDTPGEFVHVRYQD